MLDPDVCINHRDICNAHPSQSLGAGDERGGEEVIEYIQIYVDMCVQIYPDICRNHRDYYPSQSLGAGDERGGEEEEAW